MPERARRNPPPRRPWAHALAFVAAGVLVGLLVWAFEPGAEEKAQEESDRLRKVAEREVARTDPPTARRAPRGLRLAGSVQAGDGVPVKGATVFVLPKKLRGGTRDDLPHEVTDAQGRWSFHAKSVFDHWIGVVARGYGHAYLDGDRVDPDVQMVHVLEEVEPLWVTLVDETGAPIRRKGVQLDPWPPTDTFFLPGPGARQGEQWAVTDEDGDLRFDVGSRGPVILRPNVEGRHAGAHPTWLPQPTGAITLRMLPNRSLHVQIRDEDGAPLQCLATADLYDAAEGRLALSFTENLGADGVLRVERGVPPGEYDLHVHAEGRTRVILPALALRGDDATLPDVVTVGLGEAPAHATLTVRLEGAAGGARRLPATARRRAPLVYLWRDEPAWRNLGWQAGAPDEWRPSARTLVFQLPPGRYHLLAADVVSGRAALARDITLDAAASLELAAVLRNGVLAPTTALRLGDGHARTIRVTAASDLPLPVYGSAREGKLRVSTAPDAMARTAEGEAVLLGPYPADTVTVTVTNWDGTQREATAVR